MPSTTTLQDFVLCVHFESPLSMSVLELADWVSGFRDDFPEVQQLPVLPSVELATGQQAITAAIEPGYVLPRMMLRSADNQFTIQLQQDRLAVGWVRATPLGEPAGYPGYDRMRTLWLEIFDRFTRWHEHRLGGAPGLRIAEIGYSNAEPIVVNGQQRRLSQIFRFVHPSERELSGFQAAWTEMVPEAGTTAQVAAQTNVGVAPPDQVVFAYNFNGFAAIQKGGTIVDAAGYIDAMHARILDIRKAAIISPVEEAQ